MVNQVEWLKGETRKHKDPIQLAWMVNQVGKLKPATTTNAAGAAETPEGRVREEGCPERLLSRPT
jgi:hypothetical protein